MKVRLGRFQAFFAFCTFLAAPLLAGVAMAEETDVVEWTDTEGDAVSIRREGGQINLYGNGDLAMANVLYMQVDGLTITFGGKEDAAQSTAHNVAVVEKLQALFEQEQQRHHASSRTERQQQQQQPQQPAATGAPSAGAPEDTHGTPAVLLQALAAHAGKKPRVAVDVSSSGRSKAGERLRELVIYAEGDPHAPGAKEHGHQQAKEDTHRSALPLGRHSFESTVLRGGSTVANHWIVLFCYSWWEPCQRMEEPYSVLGDDWQGKLNHDLFKQEVRFAKVDCATDKELCNSQGVEGFPHVQHFAGGSRVAKWTGGRQNDLTRLEKWIKKQLGGEPNAASAAADKKSQAGVGAEETSMEGLGGLGAAFWERGVDVLLVAGVLALNFGVVCRNAGLWKAPPKPRTDGGDGGPPSDDGTAQQQQPMATAAEQRPARQCLLPVQWAESRASLEL